MKRLIFLVVCCLGLAGCSSTTKKIEEATLDHLEQSYHVTDAEVLSIEPTKQFGPFFVVMLERMLAGRTFHVNVKVHDATSTLVKGTVNERELVFRNDNYVPAKHKKLKEESDKYLQLLNELNDLGIEVAAITKGIDHDLYHQDIRLLNFVLHVKTTAFEGDKVVQRLQDLSTYILEDIDATVEVNLQIPLPFYEFDKFTENTVEIELTHANEQKFVEKLNQQMIQADLTTQVDKNLKTEIETLNMELSSSRLVEKHQSNQDNFFQHTLSLTALKGYEDSDLLNVIHLLKEKGFDESYVGLYFANGYTDTCQVKQVQGLADISRCYSKVYGF